MHAKISISDSKLWQQIKTHYLDFFLIELYHFYDNICQLSDAEKIKWSERITLASGFNIHTQSDSVWHWFENHTKGQLMK